MTVLLLAVTFGMTFPLMAGSEVRATPVGEHAFKRAPDPGKAASAAADDGTRERQYFVSALTRIADPLLEALSRNRLKALMPVECQEGRDKDRRQVTYLEAMGRLLSGMAPWLELGPDKTAEGQLREKYIGLALKSIHNATDPRSPDFMNFNKYGQPLVDAAFFAEALLRAPHQLWDRLDPATKKNVIAALKSSRAITPGDNNWLFFSAMVEMAILKFEGDCEMKPVNRAIDMHMKWYKGDGTYGDGAVFHWDYYNSFVIQPMFLEVLQTMIDKGQGDTSRYRQLYPVVLKRARRYAAIEESMISPEGTYPPIGRSLAYRFGAFHLLSKIARMHKLPAEISPRQVRAALYTVVKRQLEAPGTFDGKGWLRIGIVGHQPSVGEGYISTGSLYLCSEAFLVLGLKPDDAFWTGGDEDWTAKKVWKGEDVHLEHALD
ncbi:DUF2264 domain-containing protein [Compostibacter hankyongensis]